MSQIMNQKMCWIVKWNTSINVGLDLHFFNYKSEHIKFLTVPPAVLSRSRISAERKRNEETIQEEEEAQKNEAGNWVRAFPYNSVERAVIRKKDGAKIYYIHWTAMRIWHTVREMMSTVPKTIFKASELKLIWIDRPWRVNCKLKVIAIVFFSFTINLITCFYS